MHGIYVYLNFYWLSYYKHNTSLLVPSSIRRGGWGCPLDLSASKGACSGSGCRSSCSKWSAQHLWSAVVCGEPAVRWGFLCSSTRLTCSKMENISSNTQQTVTCTGLHRFRLWARPIIHGIICPPAWKIVKRRFWILIISSRYMAKLERGDKEAEDELHHEECIQRYGGDRDCMTECCREFDLILPSKSGGYCTYLLNKQTVNTIHSFFVLWCCPLKGSVLIASIYISHERAHH